MIGIYLGGNNVKGIIDKRSYLCQESYVNIIPTDGTYPDYKVIEKINSNENGYFDFSKGMIDIGSELGQFSLNTNFGYYYMFDGNRKKCIMANANMLIREKDEICEIHNVLLSDKIENIEYDGFDTSYSGTFNSERPEDREEIHIQQSTTLDSFNFSNIGFIKIDVEGMEEKVLRGGIGTIIRNNYPPILFECWNADYHGMTQEKHDSLVKFIEDLGYEIFWYWGDFETHLAIHK